MSINLKDEIVAGEAYSLEFKRVPNEEREKYLKTVVAFANGKGGRILFGVANDRTVVGIPNYMRYIEEWGSGLRRVNRVLAEYGIRPVAIDEAAFATQMNVYRVTDSDNEGNREGNEGNEPNESNHDPNEPNREPNGTNDGTNGTNSGTNGTNQIIECVRKTPTISLDELAGRIGVSRRTIVRMIDRLKKQGRIRRKGGTRGVWEVL